MDITSALEILESAAWLCIEEDIRTPELLEALDLLEPLIEPKWLIPQYRRALDGYRDGDVGKEESRQRVLSATIAGIYRAVVPLLGQRIDELARKYAETDDQKFKAELEELSRQFAELKKRLIF